jgi:hypothetical protein
LRTSLLIAAAIVLAAAASTLLLKPHRSTYELEADAAVVTAAAPSAVRPMRLTTDLPLTYADTERAP